MDNLEYWNALKQPPPGMCKKITGGRLKGMTDIKPQWRYLALTKEFGPVGDGWKYTIDKLWIEEGANGVQVANALISLFIRYSESWSDPIPGIGGSMLTAKESGGLYTSDEAFKMAVTDAISYAAAKAGVGANIYMGQANTKYAPPKPLPKQTTAKKPATKKPAAKKVWTDAQKKKLIEMSTSLTMTEEDKVMFAGWVAIRCGVDTWDDIPSAGKAGFVVSNFDKLYDEFYMERNNAA